MTTGDVESFSVYNVTGQMSNLYWGWSKRISKFDENGYTLNRPSLTRIMIM